MKREACRVVEYARADLRSRLFCPTRYGNYAVYGVGPSNDHELEIAREVDKHSEHKDLSAAAVPEILAFLDFKLSGADQEFLVRYIEWRLANPIVK